MSGARRWIAGAALVLCAGLATALTPPADSTYDEFLVGDGAAAAGRTLSASLTGATFARTVVSSDGDWRADGHWLIVELTASAPRSEVDAEVVLATLHVGGTVFQASERVPDTLAKRQLRVGTDTAGVLVFELPDDVTDGTAQVRLSTAYSTPQLDDVLVLSLPLDDLPAASLVELSEPMVGTR